MYKTGASKRGMKYSNYGIKVSNRGFLQANCDAVRNRLQMNAFYQSEDIG